MRSDILGRVAVDLLSVPPLIFRVVRRKLIKTSLADIDIDIKFAHFEIMQVLREKGTLHVAEIGERLQIAKAQMTHLIDKLVELDMVERNVDTADRRTINIKLTDRAMAFLEEHESSVINAMRDNMASLTDTELESLSDSLRNLRDILAKLQ